ncbi:GNAT family N-acetyltransferase [Inquilinus sp. NPDC058860]|uniref:GNAT family N-acetyltransferase n=1 Tax=Inquilinus sp. NPDC058860 TaxID=3346652 RepID=UPI00369B070A
MPDETPRYSVFIEGETLDLCVPSEVAIEDGWADWFNDARTTRWLAQGIYPNHVEDQRSFLESIRKRDRFAVLICGKGGGPLYGIISLSAIDWVARSAQISLVVGKPLPGRRLIQLEAMARVTEHAFQRMGLDRIWAGQAHPGLARWNQWLELLGYFTDGIMRRGFVKGRETVDNAVMICCLVEDYEVLKARRDGRYWPGNDTMLRLIAGLPRQGFATRLGEFLERELPLHKAEMEALEQRVLQARDDTTASRRKLAAS